MVAETIAAQTELDSTKSDLTSLTGTTANAMHWKGDWTEPYAYVIGDMVYHTADYVYYVALADNNGKTPGAGESVGIWEPTTRPITGLPEITGGALPADGNYSLTINGGSAQWQILDVGVGASFSGNSLLYNRYVTWRLEPSTSNVKHGKPLSLIQTVPAKATGTGNGGVITANSAAETDVYNSWTLVVVEDVSGNATNPVSVEDTANQKFVCTVNNTVNTTFNAIITSWNAAATAKIVVDLAAGTYDPSAMAPAAVVVTMGTNGVLDEIQCTPAIVTANCKEATVYGLAYHPTTGCTANLTPGADISVQVSGVMVFTANQSVNTFNTGISGGNLLIPGSAFYLSSGNLVENEPPTANTYSTPIGLAKSKTELELRLGLPIKTVV
jgi:hypothetical protein